MLGDFPSLLREPRASSYSATQSSELWQRAGRHPAAGVPCLASLLRLPPLSGAAAGTKEELGSAEEPLQPLTAALRELRAMMTDPSQHDGEDSCGQGCLQGCPWARWVERAQRLALPP